MLNMTSMTSKLRNGLPCAFASRKVRCGCEHFVAGPFIKRGSTIVALCEPTEESRLNFSVSQLSRGCPPAHGSGRSSAFDIVGLGQAMVDYAGMVSEEELARLEVPKGGRRVINVQERTKILDELASVGFQLHAGGSLANTLGACGILSQAESVREPTRPSTRVAMAGSVGDDHLGTFFQAQLRSSGVEWLSPAAKGNGTGTVIVLTTPDAQRSFLAFPAATAPVTLCPRAAVSIAAAKVLVVEGYLWELPSAATTIARAIALARACGTQVALTAADKSVVLRHRAAMLTAVRSADLVFANAEEAHALTCTDGIQSDGTGALAASRTADELACSLSSLCSGSAIVTDGSRGSAVASRAGGEHALHVVPPCWAESAPVDTCGAGDAYAAGFLHGLITGLPVRRCGELAAAAASAVISRPGPELSAAAAQALVDTYTLPEGIAEKSYSQTGPGRPRSSLPIAQRAWA